MEAITTMELSGWGRYPRALSSVQIPKQASEIDLRSLPHVIARGLGRSYGNAAMLNQGLVVLTERLREQVSFNGSTGLLTAQAGMPLADVLTLFAPQGWFPPVVPGTKWVSLGGCVAADIHGKNHHRDGTFGCHVRALNLRLADGSQVRCTPEENKELFWATVGGMGLTGVITEVTLQLIKIETPWIISQHHQARDLDASLELLESDFIDDAYTVAWLDCLARGRSLGRSILIRGHHAQREELPAHLRSQEPRKTAPALSIPFDFPAFVLNGITVATLNKAYYLRQGMRTAPFVCDPDSFFFPLDRIANWNRLYGKRGFVQYQCVLPLNESRQGLQALLEETRGSHRASFLAVLKRFGPEGQGILSFPLEGFTLTMDFPITDEGLFSFLDRLDEIVVRHRGRVYLAKDARLRAEVFRNMYPRLAEWQRIKTQVDPRTVFDSDLARRIGMSEKVSDE